ncbi:hypothetical protein ACLB2K_056980 [Fragaria x ananassa]
MLTGVLPSSLGDLFGEAEASTGTVLGMAFIGAGMHLPTTCRTDADEISTAWRRGSNKFSIRIGSVSSDLGMSPVYIVASSRSDVVIGLWRAVVRLREGGGYRVWTATTVVAVGLGRWWLTTRDPLLPSWLMRCGSMPSISSFTKGQCGLCPDKRTQSVVIASLRQRVLCLVKWSQPLFDRVKSSHNGKADIHSLLWLHMSFSFLLCRHVLCKANRVVNDTLFANLLLLECICCVRSPNIVFRCSCIMGFRLYVPPLYSAISVIVTA